ncbi:MAG: hypothetical protein KBT35_03510 [Firmicutes bacterium]|nr:hypothetical protein [Candidatus Colivicinus equi]
MQPKNIVLLGFVNKAVEYLDKHIDDDKSDYKLNKLKNIDLVSLEEELSKNLEFSLGTYQSTMTSLLKAGNEAFEDFLDAHAEKVNLLGDLSTIFDNGALDTKRDEKQELEDLLSFYNLDVDDEIIQEDFVEELPQDNAEEESFEQIIGEDDKENKEKDIEEVTTKILDKILTNNPLLKALVDAANSNEIKVDDIKEIDDHKEDVEIDNIENEDVETNDVENEDVEIENTNEVEDGDVDTSIEDYQIEENIEVATDELLENAEQIIIEEDTVESNSDGVLEDLIDNSEVDNEDIIIEDNNAIDDIEDEFLKQIVKAADENKDINNAEFDELYESSNNDEIDSIFSEIIDHENNVEERLAEETFSNNEEIEPTEEIVIPKDEEPVIEEDTVFEEEKVEIQPAEEIVIPEEVQEEVAVEEITIPEEVQDETVVEETEVLEKEEEITEPVVEDIPEVIEQPIEEPIIEPTIDVEGIVLTDALEDEIPVEEEYVDAKVDTEQELRTITNYVPETLDSLVNEIKEEIEPEITVQPSTESTAQTYVSSLIDDLKKQMLEEEKAKVQEDEQRQAIYEEIHKSYPYLSSAFVKSVYDLKNSINDEYAEGMKVILLSRIIFKNVEELRQFAEVVMNHGYQINVDEKQMIVDCIKQLTNSRGKIIALIFDIANQAAALNGVYEGYRVIVDEV